MGRISSATFELGLADLDRFGGAAGMDVAADVVLRRDPAQRGIFVADLQRPAVHQEEADVALLRRRHIGLGDDVAVALDRLDHLVEVATLLGVDLEHARAARSLQRLQDDVAAMRLGERLHVARMLVIRVSARTSSGKDWK